MEAASLKAEACELARQRFCCVLSVKAVLDSKQGDKPHLSMEWPSLIAIS